MVELLSGSKSSNAFSHSDDIILVENIGIGQLGVQNASAHKNAFVCTHTLSVSAPSLQNNNNTQEAALAILPLTMRPV